jgi:hypothetical protein
VLASDLLEPPFEALVENGDCVHLGACEAALEAFADGAAVAACES